MSMTLICNWCIIYPGTSLMLNISYIKLKFNLCIIFKQCTQMHVQYRIISIILNANKYV